MNNNHACQFFKKILKLSICVGLIANKTKVFDFLTTHSRVAIAIIFPMSAVILIMAIEAMINIIHYIHVLIFVDPDSELEDVFTANLRFFLPSGHTSTTEEDMFRPDGSLTYQGKVRMNSMLHQRDMYNRSSTHKYYDDRK